MMSAGEWSFYRYLLLSWYGIAGITCGFLFFIKAPYGRYSRPGRGPAIASRFGWLIMESVSPLVFNLFLFLGKGPANPVTAFFALLWNLHYLNRALIYPFRRRYGERPMTLWVMLLAIFFNSINGYLNGRYLNAFSHLYQTGWLGDPRFICGLFLFVAGFGINYHSDGILRKLRRSGEQGYRIPHGGLFHLVSSANYLGEMVEWLGWACLTWSPTGLSFAVWTAGNLIPRAWAHHRWYREVFPDYPKGRKALLPFLL